MDTRKAIDLIDECISFIDSSSGQSEASVSNNSNKEKLSSLNLRVNSASLSRASMTPSVGLRSTAPEPPSPSAYAYDPNVKPISENTNRFPSKFPVTSPKADENENNENNNDKLIPKGNFGPANGVNGELPSNSRPSDNEEDLDSDVEEEGGGGKDGNKKLTATEQLILEENSREAHLRPKYYTLCIDSRPFGVALCKKFDENYLCVALPESPSGQLGLRTGSQILGIDQFIIDSMNYSLCNTKFPSFAHSWFYMMGFDKINWLTTHLPINFFLKYDPLQVLAEGTKKREKNQTKDGTNTNDASDAANDSATGAAASASERKDSEKKEEECDFWRQMQEDIYRWAIEKRPEYWKIVESENNTSGEQDGFIDVMSMPPIDSKGVQLRLQQRYKYLKDKDLKKRKPEWEKRNGREPSNNSNENENNNENTKEGTSAFSVNIMEQDIVQFDDEYKRVGTLDVGSIVSVFAKAGAWLEIREPIRGWIQFFDAKTNMTYLRKCNESEISQVKANQAELDANVTEFDKLKQSYKNMNRKKNIINKIESYRDTPLSDITGNPNDILSNRNGDFSLRIQTTYIKTYQDMAYDLQSVESKQNDLNNANNANSANDASNTSNGTEDNKEEKKEEAKEQTEQIKQNENDGTYWLSDIIMNDKSDLAKNKQSVIYFMGDLDFGYTLKTIDTHLKRLQALQRRIGNQTVNWIVVKVCGVIGTSSDNALKPVTFKTEDNIVHNLSGFVVGRAPINLLKLYGLNEYDTGFFKYGLLMTESNGDILIHPTEDVQSSLESIESKIRG